MSQVDQNVLNAPVFPHHAAAAAHAVRLAAAHAVPFAGRTIGDERDRLDAQENAAARKGDGSTDDVGELPERIDGMS